MPVGVEAVEGELLGIPEVPVAVALGGDEGAARDPQPASIAAAATSESAFVDRCIPHILANEPLNSGATRAILVGQPTVAATRDLFRGRRD